MAETNEVDEANGPRVEREGSAVGLRLAIGREGLGIELAHTSHVACFALTELVVRLPRVKFPFDVTGGVAKFRHKRGELERLTLELDVRTLEAWMAPRLRGLFTTGGCHVSVEPRKLGATVTVYGKAEPHARTRPHDGASSVALDVAALAFEVDVTPSENDLVLVVHGARGANLRAAASKLALEAMSALLGPMGKLATREGSRFLVARPAAHLVRHLLPEAGVRAPSGEGVLLSGSGESDGVWVFIFERGAVSCEGTERATRALEAANVLRIADDTRMTSSADRARTRDLEALERAPKHPEIVRRIVETDALATGRAEAALATLRDASGPVWMGLVPGLLHLEANDVPSAIAAFVREAERDRSNVMGALAYAAAARTTTDRRSALLWLDQAVARAPLLAELRWERARLRLHEGRLEGARADLQELEALARGPRERLDVVRRGAELYREAGLGDAASALYERALLYAPEDPEALFGLGVSMAREGRNARGAALIAHAIELAGKRAQPTSKMELALGHLLAERLNDRPAAIARIRNIPDADPEAVEARGLEGRLRAFLGDVAGASLAFARLRARGAGEAAAVPWLVEASHFEASRGDLFAAQRHAEAALAAQPQSEELLALHRDLGARIARASGAVVPDLATSTSIPKTIAPPDAIAPDEPTPLADANEAFDEATAEERVESLTRAVQADPANDAAVDELTMLLSRLGRSMELFALLSARLEEAPPERRDVLLPKHREALETLERLAREDGRLEEAELFKMARENT